MIQSTAARYFKNLFVWQRIILTVLLACLSLNIYAQEGLEVEEAQAWLPKIENLEDWKKLSRPERDAEFSKFFIDVKTNKIYFVDTNVFPLHIDFGLGYLLKQFKTPQNIKNFNRNYSVEKPQFILGYLTHYPKLDLWTFSFWEGDAITPVDVIKTYRVLQKSFFATPLSFRPDSYSQEKMAKILKRSNVPVVLNDQIYQQLPFVAFQTGQVIGYLKIIPTTTLIEDMVFSPTDIVLLQSSYPDISPVGGIITTKFSTPLAHVNLRASAWGIPNASLKTAADEFAALNNQLVVYQVSEQGLTLRAASEEEAIEFEEQQGHQQRIILLEVDLDSKALKPLSKIRAQNVNQYGAKTANLGELVYHHLDSVHIPSGFGIPFAFYEEHIQAHNIDKQISSILIDKRFIQDASWRKAQLLEIQSAIMAAPISSELMKQVNQRWRDQLKGKGVFVRSSTNAEDLKGFNGAGLYDTVPNVTTQPAMEEAIKKVWASVWSLRAVNERNFYGIDHQTVYPAVLIQTGVNATAAGVLITKDIWAHNPNTFYINAKWGLGMSVVEGVTVPEQVLYDYYNHGVRVISRTGDKVMLVFDLKNGIKEVPVKATTPILTNQRARNLGSAVVKMMPIFKNDLPLDVEWVLEGEKIWIVQVRPYVEHKITINK